jgi:hypothetical protein
MINVSERFRPKERKPYPPDNSPGFEEWFASRYQKEDNTSGIKYLPVMWTEYFKRCNYGQDRIGLKKLQMYLDTIKEPCFTICQYDDGCLIQTKGIKFYNMGAKGDYQLPLLCQPRGKVNVSKNLLANFIGKVTHPIRTGLLELKGKEGYFISTEQTGLESYTHILASSVFTLCPRGYGKTSFRIAEALEQGSIPVYISDEFLEPYGELFTKYGLTITEYDLPILNDILCAVPDWKVLELQMIGAEVYKQYFSFEGAYKYIIQSLNQSV